MEPVELRTPRTELSPPTRHDVPAIFQACQDADIQRYTAVPSPYLLEHAEAFVDAVPGRWADGIEATWAIRLDDRLVGMLGMHRLTTGSPEIGYWMTRGARGRGLLTEAAAAVVEWALAPDGLGAARLEWRAVVGNRASARVARALGFRYEGTLRHALVNSFGRDDAWIAGLLPGDDRTPQPWSVLGD
ncbi:MULTISPECIES: GNAT family N-acetyltransferase [Microbacterium]|uniref:N-acetyltransferase n=1 Tax=Microbacterium wangchenii TaxID=2541726 RepID=A0ABX5SPG6_9MICO|nr:MULTISPECIES: GNAT family N-acetyltransferase [Microbacterium]MCK6066712.1 GNAT family N-acetyltransferase [Microbacterium sp. EYE_512]QBR88038.1 N-acetyltransferase [Microbacterium wangchenii]TFV83845.1 N-acetyltransferase [Microbacterium sp. dk485]TXK18172.1 GNAT family N-acetyltransferase [Microbacterium wangchenii]